MIPPASGHEPGGLSTVLLKNARVFAPHPWPTPVVDILVVGTQVAALGSGLVPPAWSEHHRDLDAEGRVTIPGLIDQHVHIAGGGGEGGPVYRTPEVEPSSLVEAGITTVVGVLGTDGVTRSVPGLVAKARSLRAQHLTAYVYTGAYEVPTRTVTANARTDLVMIDEVVGVGEIAVSDQRGSHPSVRDLAGLAGEARVGGLLGGKAGVLHLHVGDGPGRLEPLFQLIQMADVPVDTLVPTHLNRNPGLLGEALEWIRRGGYADFTTGIRPDARDQTAVCAHEAVLAVREAGLPLSRVSFSSDAQGSAPVFDAAGHLQGVGIGSAATLLDEVYALVQAGWDWPAALAPVTTVPAEILKLRGCGRIFAGGPADLVVLEDREVWHVISQGHIMREAGHTTGGSPFRADIG